MILLAFAYLKVKGKCMKNLRFTVSMFLFMVAIMMMGTGCQSMRKLWPWGKKPTIDTNFRTPAAATTDLTVPGAADGTGLPADWNNMDKGLPPRKNGITPIKDARWDGVVLYFAYDSTNVGDAEKPKLEALAQYMKENPEYAVVIEGHCDERGSDEYNRGLGERRALAVRDYLVNLGIADTRFETISYGEEKPAVPNAKTESEFAKNRRAEFVIGTRNP